MSERTIKVQDLELREGVWHALVTVEGFTRRVDRTFGSWRVTPDPSDTFSLDVRPDVAAALQRALRKAERGAKVGTVSVPLTKESSMAAKAKASTSRKVAKAKQAAKKVTSTRKASTPRKTRPVNAKGAKALKLREEGKSYPEIAKALGWANPGVAWNAVKRAKDAQGGGAGK
jgi:hypothetical protein